MLGYTLHGFRCVWLSKDLSSAGIEACLGKDGNGKERKGKDGKGKERKGEDGKGKERRGKERVGK